VSNGTEKPPKALDSVEDDLGRELTYRSGLEYLLAEPAPVERLCHYTTPNGFRGIVESRSIWLTNAAYLNDPAEVHYPMTFSTTLLKHVADHARDERLEKLLSDVMANCELLPRVRHWFVASLSKEPNLLSQWRAYCPSSPW
jgi:hypothetical protein